MKVLMLSLEYPPYIYGGAGVHVDNLSRALAKKMDVEVRCRGEEKLMVNGNPTVRYFPMPERYNGEKWARVLNTIVFDTDVVSQPSDANIVHSHTWYMALSAIEAKKLYEIPLVATVHSLEPHRPWKREQIGTGHNLTTFLEHSLYREADAVIAVSKATKRDLLDVYPDVEPGRVHVIHNGIDTSKFYPQSDGRVLERYGIKQPYILFVGRLSRQKGIFDVVEACKRGLIKENIVLVTGAPDTKEIVDEIF